MAAGYTLRELMEYMGHSSLQGTDRCEPPETLGG